MGKRVLRGAEARQKLAEGFDFLADAVGCTLGPAGRNALLYSRHANPIITKDGVTVANSIDAEDLGVDAAVQLIKSVARNTADQAGDGTTTATVLARAIYKGGLEAITQKANPVIIKRGIDKAVQAVCGPGGLLDSVSRPVQGEQITQVAAVAANNDPELGKIIAAALNSAGPNGVITVDDSKTFDTTLERVEGMELGCGYISPYFINDFDRQECVFEQALLLIHEQKLTSMKALVPLLERVKQINRPLLIIAENIEGDLLQLLVVNRLQGNLNVCAVKAPGIGSSRKEQLGDIAALSGGKAIIQDLGIATEKIQLADLGTAAKVVVKRDRTVISGGAGTKEAIEARIQAIQTQMPAVESPYERDRMQERLAKLSGGVSIIRMGAASEVELLERKARVEDAIHATRAAMEQGIVPGGGVTLAKLSDRLLDVEMHGDELTGREIVMRAMHQPFRTIVSNSGYEPDGEWNEIAGSKFEAGFDALTGNYPDMFEAGIVDPTMVVRLELQNAASVAGSLLTSEVLIVEDVKPQSAEIKLPRRP